MVFMLRNKATLAFRSVASVDQIFHGPAFLFFLGPFQYADVRALFPLCPVATQWSFSSGVCKDTLTILLLEGKEEITR